MNNKKHKFMLRIVEELYKEADDLTDLGCIMNGVVNAIYCIVQHELCEKEAKIWIDLLIKSIQTSSQRIKSGNNDN